MGPAALATCALLGALMLSCRSDQKGGSNSPQADLAAREARVSAAARTPESEAARPDQPVARWILPNTLSEISGLAFVRDGFVLAHNDERGAIWEIDYRRGVIRKEFLLGSPTVHADFEGIAVAQGNIFLVTSAGKLYQFFEGSQGEHVPYTVHDTDLAIRCEVEGLAYDPAIESLLLACKVARRKGLENTLLVYRWPLEGSQHKRLNALKIPLEDVIRGQRFKDFHPSSIDVHPVTGNYLLLAGQEEALVEITSEGKVVSTRPLARNHYQPEGLALTPDGLLVISDEARQWPAAITVYRGH